MLMMTVGGAIASMVPFGDVLFGIFVSTPIIIGVSWWIVLASRGENPSKNEIFAVFSDKYMTVVGASFVAMLIFYVIFFGAILIGAAIGGVSMAAVYAVSEQAQAGQLDDIAWSVILGPVIIALVIGSLLGLFVYVRLMWVGLIALDPEENATSVGECLGRCWKMTALSWCSLFFLMLLLCIIMALSFLLLCVGYFLLGLPLYIASYTAGYILLRQ